MVVVGAVVGLAVGLTVGNSDDVPSVGVLIVGTNDIHGGYYSTLLSRKDTGERYGYGGL